MKHYALQDYDFFCTEEFLPPFPEDSKLLEQELFWIHFGFCKKRWKDLSNGRYAILSAHGGNNSNGQWCFYDEIGEHRVQEWLDSIDGKVRGALLLICNPENASIATRESLVVHAATSLSRLNLKGQFPLRLYLPSQGYQELSYN